jgi:hypothetical protein
MKQNETPDEISEMETLYSKLSYEEFVWILNEIQIFPSNFVKNIHISRERLRKYKIQKCKELPLFITFELANACRGEKNLKYLRIKFKLQNIT